MNRSGTPQTAVAVVGEINNVLAMQATFGRAVLVLAMQATLVERSQLSFIYPFTPPPRGGEIKESVEIIPQPRPFLRPAGSKRHPFGMPSEEVGRGRAWAIDLNFL